MPFTEIYEIHFNPTIDSFEYFSDNIQNMYLLTVVLIIIKKKT